MKLTSWEATASIHLYRGHDHDQAHDHDHGREVGLRLY
jgi:hypothetical protein